MKTIGFPLLVFCWALTSASAQENRTPPVLPSVVSVDPGALTGSARTSKLIGTQIYQGDASIGAIEDILVDLQHGTLTAVIVSVGGFLGIGEKRVAIAPSQVLISSEARFTTVLSKTDLMNLSPFDYAKVKQ